MLALCDGRRSEADIAALLPEPFVQTADDAARYVSAVLKEHRLYLSESGAPAFAPRYAPAELLYLPKARTATGRSLSPVRAALSLTYRCNFRCVYCYNDSGPSRRACLGTAEWLEAVRQLSEETDCQTVLLTGGEPMIHPGFFDILAAGRRAGMIVDFTTNGSLVDDEAVRRFADLGVRYVRVSLDSPYAEKRHQLTRTTDTFGKVTRAIESMAKAGVAVGVKGLLYDGNYKDALALTRFAESLGASEVMLDAYTGTNVGRGRGEMALSPAHIAAVEADKRRVTGKLSFTTRYSPRPWRCESEMPLCEAWQDSVSINPTGVFPFCETLADDPFFVLGRFPAERVMEVWRSPKIDEIRHPKRSQCESACAQCALFARCRTGCYRNKTAAEQRPYARDPYCRVEAPKEGGIPMSEDKL